MEKIVVASVAYVDAYVKSGVNNKLLHDDVKYFYDLAKSQHLSYRNILFDEKVCFTEVLTKHDGSIELFIEADS